MIIKDAVILNNEEILLRIKEYKETGCERALQDIIYSCVRMINDIIASINYCEKDREDLFQEGVLGVVKAIEKYDSTKSSFSNFVYYWIKNKIIKFIKAKSYPIILPYVEYTKIGKINDIISKYKEHYPGGPSFKYLLKKTGLKENNLRALLKIQEPFLDIDAKVDDCNETLQSIISDERDIYEEIEKNEFIELMIECLNNLPEREQFILRNRYGLTEERKTLTLKEIAEKIGLTVERVRQIEKEARREIGNKIKKYERVGYY